MLYAAPRVGQPPGIRRSGKAIRKGQLARRMRGLTMMELPRHRVRWFFDSAHGPADRIVPRWLFLRALAAIYFSAFFSLIFQIKGLIGPDGILPAGHYLAAVARSLGPARFWYAPSLFWISASSHMLIAVTWIGLVASVLALVNLWPRICFLVCFVCFLSFVAASGEFSGYQSDGMLLEAGFLALFFAPPGLLPGWAAAHPPPRASLFLLQWEWFRIYFESGLVKLLSGDTQWRHLSAMDEYYQNGPLPTWVGWYVEHLPHGFHAFTAGGTLVLEFLLVFLLFLPRRFRLICFCIVTPLEIGVIVTSNYAFLNYLVLSLGVLLLDDRVLIPLLPARFRPVVSPDSTAGDGIALPASNGPADGDGSIAEPVSSSTPASDPPYEPLNPTGRLRAHIASLRIAITAVMLVWIGYDTTAELITMPFREVPLPTAPITALEPFRIANQYGLFAVMTRGRYEIEFQGSNDNQNWTAYPFRYKPQALNEAPGIYAPYQPRFDWNLWFASLGDWQQNQMVPLTEERLLRNDADVLSLFRGSPFSQSPPRYVRAVLWRYWFTSMDEKRLSGNWWRRQMLGQYAPTITSGADGKISVVQWPDELPSHD